MIRSLINARLRWIGLSEESKDGGFAFAPHIGESPDVGSVSSPLQTYKREIPELKLAHRLSIRKIETIYVNHTAQVCARVEVAILQA